MATGSGVRQSVRCWLSRRGWLRQFGGGIAGLALFDLMGRDSFGAAGLSSTNPLAPKPPHFAPKARAVISLFMSGGVSQVDSFDPKPELNKRHLEAPPASLDIKTFFPNPGTLLKTPFSFRRYGQSGLEISELFPETGACADDLTVVRSLYTVSNNHAPATLQMMTGNLQPGRPCLGSWSVYGLGSENQNLPAFVVLLDKTGGPIGGPQNWSAGFIPGVYQGTPFSNQGDPLLDISPPDLVSSEHQRRRLDFIQSMNRIHLEGNRDEGELAARMASYELAFRMQSSAPEAVDLNKESKVTKALYGLDNEVTRHFGRNCLLARRLVERGVRFVQLFGGANAADSWDAHQKLEENHRRRAKTVDKPIRGLLEDLKARGLLDSTLVVFHTEFGRLPISQSIDGRDHSPHGFSCWLAGGGIRGGQVIGMTDEFGYKPVKDPFSVHDLHATILHLLGLEHTKLTFHHNGREFRLTDVAGNVIEDAIA